VHQREIDGDKEEEREGGRVRERYGKSEGVRYRERGLKRATKWCKGVVRASERGKETLRERSRVSNIVRMSEGEGE
jgi:hypothetical protein